ncbi:NAD-dependent epimerase/dehydratase family protein [Conexibacter sp. SYSU D00693]|uniref:NAD-dependent epimerase/dehydratase family protein n=1 Tax=Conexibacter sp. SYSU D00693 TaxID=2812560 RepID=UPI00196B5EAD|nr:NAD-dependent epimerase/dehydratase family protein [Conexibacter sp. SYSU D00693]
MSPQTQAGQRFTREAARDTLTVAVTGPTGDVGRSLLAALERTPEVGRVIGMARRPFDPAAHGWTKTEYRQGDVLDAASVRELVRDADVVVHLAFLIFGDREETRQVNLRGTRIVFEEAVAAGVRRLVYTSSVAAYGFRKGRSPRLTEDLHPEGTGDFYYSAQKAELEALIEDVVGASDTEAYVFRPCIVAGCDALLLLDEVVRQFQVGGRLDATRALLRRVPVLRPAIPDNGVPFQLVHHDDVAGALAAAIAGRGEPGVYNLAAQGELTMRDVARELGWWAVPVPDLAVDAASQVIRRLRFLPTGLAWVHALRVPSIMETAKARQQLGWTPRHDAHETLRQTVACAREQGVVD